MNALVATMLNVRRINAVALVAVLEVVKTSKRKHDKIRRQPIMCEICFKEFPNMRGKVLAELNAQEMNYYMWMHQTKLFYCWIYLHSDKPADFKSKIIDDLENYRLAIIKHSKEEDSK